MDERKIVALLITVMVMLCVGLLSLWASNNAIEYNLNDYTCEEIRSSMIKGNCLFKYKSYFGGQCFDEMEKFLSYELCKEETKGRVINLR